MSSLNKAMLIGRLGQDPGIRYTQSNTAVANFSIATSQRYKDRNGDQQETTEWHRIVAWGRLAEIIQEYVKKGSLIYVEGPLQTREWEDKDGVKKYTTEIKALSMQMLDTKDSNRSEKSNSSTGKESLQVDENFDDMDDYLPF